MIKIVPDLTGIVTMKPEPHYLSSWTHFRIISFLSVLFLLASKAGVIAEDYLYTTNNGAITITKYIGTGGAVTITNAINNLQVTSIGSNAFKLCTSLTSVTIPTSVTTIGDYSFADCYSLTNVTIPTSVTSIGDYVFADCTSLARVTIPPGVTRVGNYAFYYCTSLTNLTIPSGVTRVGDLAFYHCTSLASITIPATVTIIGSNTFESCTSLRSVTIPSGVTSIGSYTFFSCTSLTNVVIPSGVTSIGINAFYSCTSLTNVIIPASVISIGDWAFSATPLKGGYFAGNAPSLGGSNVFFGNSSTIIYYLPGTTGWISTYGGRPTALWQDIPDYLYDYKGSYITILQYTGAGGAVTIPGTLHGIPVTNIRSNAFAGYTNLTNAVIPNSITNIGNNAFASCANLTAIYFKGNAPSLGVDVFSGATNATIYYLSKTTGWDTTFGGQPTAEWRPKILGDGSFGASTNQFGFNINWVCASGLVVVVQASTNLADSFWLGMKTNTLAGDSLYFSDPQWTNYPGRYYRISSP